MNKPQWDFDKETEKRFSIKFPYDPAAIATVKAIPGASWNAKLKRWTFPLDLPTVNAVTDAGKQFNCNFVIAPELKTWVQAERKRIANLIAPDDITQASDELLPVLKAEMPALWNSLASRPFQLLGAEFIARQRNVLMADQPGMGKTIQTLAAIAENRIGGPILVVAPRTAANVTWPAEIKRWLGPNEIIYVINGTLKPDERGAVLAEVMSLRNRPERIWVITGPNYLRARADLTEDGMRYKRDAKGNKVIRVVNEGRAELFGIKWSAVVVDESHQTLAGATGNLKKQSAQRLGLGLLQTKDDGMRIALSGTPFRGKGHYMWGQIDWLEPERRPAFWQWVERHFGTTKNAFGMEINERIKDEAKFYEELKPLMVRRTKTEVVKDLPPKMYGGEPLWVAPQPPPEFFNPDGEFVSEGAALAYEAWRDSITMTFGDHIFDPAPIAVWLEMTPTQQKQYDKMKRQAMLEIQNEPDMPVNGVLAEMTRLKQIAGGRVELNGNEIVDCTVDSNKMNWILDFVEERVGAGGKVIVASQFTKFIYALSKLLKDNGYEHYLLTGRQNDAERVDAQEAFQSENGHGVFLLNTKAGGTSITLDMADDVIICDSTFNPDDQEQVEDRAHRVSRMHNVTIWNLCSRGTIDEDIAILTADRESVTKGIIDGQRGVSFTKRLVSEFRKMAA